MDTYEELIDLMEEIQEKMEYGNVPVDDSFEMKVKVMDENDKPHKGVWNIVAEFTGNDFWGLKLEEDYDNER